MAHHDEKEDKTLFSTIYDCEFDKVCNLWGESGDRITIKNNTATLTGIEKSQHSLHLRLLD